MAVFFSGLCLGFSLIVTIGAQNTFVLRQGIRNEHIFWVCFLCAVSDALLMIGGVLFCEQVRTAFPWFETALRVTGTLYLFWFAMQRFRASISATSSLKASGGDMASMLSTLASAAMLTWLNPHVYIDTVILVGSIASNFGPERWYFVSGTISASFLFFFALGYGAKALSGSLGLPIIWQVIDGVISVLLLAIAYQLLLPFFG